MIETQIGTNCLKDLENNNEIKIIVHSQWRMTMGRGIVSSINSDYFLILLKTLLILLILYLFIYVVELSCNSMMLDVNVL